MRTKITMPKDITTLEGFKAWCESQHVPPVNHVGSTDLVVCMKQRENLSPHSFENYVDYWGNEEEGTATYLIPDGISRGKAMVKNFNRVFNFYLVTYE